VSTSDYKTDATFDISRTTSCVTPNNFRSHEADDLSESDEHKVVLSDCVLRH